MLMILRLKKKTGAESMLQIKDHLSKKRSCVKVVNSEFKLYALAYIKNLIKILTITFGLLINVGLNVDLS